MSIQYTSTNNQRQRSHLCPYLFARYRQAHEQVLDPSLYALFGASESRLHLLCDNITTSSMYVCVCVCVCVVIEMPNKIQWWRWERTALWQVDLYSSNNPWFHSVKIASKILLFLEKLVLVCVNTQSMLLKCVQFHCRLSETNGQKRRESSIATNNAHTTTERILGLFMKINEACRIIRDLGLISHDTVYVYTWVVHVVNLKHTDLQGELGSTNILAVRLC